MTKSEKFIMLFILSENTLSYERLQRSGCSLSFMDGIKYHVNKINDCIHFVCGELDKEHDPEEFETDYKKHYIRELFNKADEEDACRFLKEEYLELGGKEEELYDN